jgi:hypothetical protein
MKRFILFLFLTAGSMLGCAQNHFNIPAETFAEKVKVLGVAPILVDADSEIMFPQKELLIQLIADLNRKYEPILVRKLQGTGNFYSVIQLADDPQKLFSSLVARREKRDDATIRYNKYFWKNDELASYMKNNRLDAVMVVVVSGLTNTSKLYSSNLLTSLETNFNFLTVSAQIVGPDGTVLWEYPNFRGRLLTYPPLVNLQYPDFSESEANLSRKTEVRYKSLDGIRRTLEEKRSDWLLRETPEPEVYGRLFDDMVSLVKNPVAKQTKGDGVGGKQDDALKPGDVAEKPVSEKSAPTLKPPSEPSSEPTVPVQTPK